MISFKKAYKIWNEYEFEIILGLCLAFLLLFCLYYKISGKKGTWSDSYYYSENSENVKQQKTSPTVSRGELECRRVLETLFKKEFKNQRPDFLRNPVTGGNFNLELDCYNEKLNLAVEYNGAQHYKFIPFFHKNKEAFMNQKYRDDMKRRMCKEAGVVLIEVPYTVKVEHIYEFLKNELTKYRYQI
jgi:hypothetical protein